MEQTTQNSKHMRPIREHACTTTTSTTSKDNERAHVWEQTLNKKIHRCAPNADFVYVCVCTHGDEETFYIKITTRFGMCFPQKSVRVRLPCCVVLCCVVVVCVSFNIMLYTCCLAHARILLYYVYIYSITLACELARVCACTFGRTHTCKDTHTRKRTLVVHKVAHCGQHNTLIHTHPAHTEQTMLAGLGRTDRAGRESRPSNLVRGQTT